MSTVGGSNFFYFPDEKLCLVSIQLVNMQHFFTLTFLILFSIKTVLTVIHIQGPDNSFHKLK